MQADVFNEQKFWETENLINVDCCKGKGVNQDKRKGQVTTSSFDDDTGINLFLECNAVQSVVVCDTVIN